MGRDTVEDLAKDLPLDLLQMLLRSLDQSNVTGPLTQNAEMILP